MASEAITRNDLTAILNEVLPNTATRSVTLTATTDSNGYVQIPTASIDASNAVPIWAVNPNYTGNAHPYFVLADDQLHYSLRFLQWNETVLFPSQSITVTVWYISKSVAVVHNETVDYIVEQGTSGIWTYRKWDSGKYEAWGASADSCSMTNAYGSTYYGSVSVSVASLGFVSVENIQVTGRASGSYFATKIDNFANNTLSLSCRASNSNTTTITHYIDIKGRWK